jgi:hypothetical protein
MDMDTDIFIGIDTDINMETREIITEKDTGT